MALMPSVTEATTSSVSVEVVKVEKTQSMRSGSLSLDSILESIRAGKVDQSRVLRDQSSKACSRYCLPSWETMRWRSWVVRY